jgi:putative inorganic carbon (HCO3(-)) transporter
MKRLYSYLSTFSPLFFLCSFLILALCPPLRFNLIHNFFEYDMKRLLQISLFFSAVVSVLISPGILRSMLDNFAQMRALIKYALSLFFLIGLISSFHAKIPMASLVECASFLLLLLYALFWHSVGVRMGKNIFLATVFLPLVALTAYFCFIFSAYQHYLIGRSPFNLFPYFQNLRQFARFMGWVIPILPLLTICARKSASPFILRPIFFVFSSLCWFLVISNVSRALFASLILSSLITIVYFRRNSFAWFFHQFSYLGTAVLLYFILQHNHFFPPTLTPNNVLQHIYNGIFSDRIYHYLFALKLSIAHPFLGVGPMHFALYREAGSTKPHNFILLILSEWGIPALLVFLGVVFSTLKQFMSSLKRVLTINEKVAQDVNLIVVAQVTALLTGLIFSLFSPVMSSPLSQVFFSVTLGNCMTLSRYSTLLFDNKDTAKRKVGVFEKQLSTTILSAVIVFSTAVYSVGVIPQISTLSKSTVVWLLNHPEDQVFYPRFWAQAWLFK